MTRPVLLVTNHVPPDRAGAFAELHERVGLELALFGGRSHHATAGVELPGVPQRRLDQRAVARLAASGRHRAVVCGTAGRVALPAAYAGARAGRVPFVLWSALWADLLTPAHVAAWPLLHHVQGHADAVVAYGSHVAAHARRHGARIVHVAPQAVDGAFWAHGARPRDARAAPASEPLRVLFVGRDDPGKGLDVLLAAWRQGRPPGATLQIAGVLPARLPFGAHATGPVAAHEVRNFLGRADVLVMPSVPTRAFREPWGLIANEAMHQHVPVIATTAVGAAVGGLVRHERNGLVVPAGDATALSGALARLDGDREQLRRLGDAAARDVAPFTFAAWAAGFEQALATVAPN